MKSQIKQTSEQGEKILLETKRDTANDKRINLPGRHNNLNTHISNKRASKYMKTKKMIGMKGETDKCTIIAETFQLLPIDQKNQQWNKSTK